MAAVKAFFKKEPVLVVSGALAFLSVFFVPPSAAYLSYIDFRTLGILFCLMAAVAGLSGAGVFDAMARVLSQKAGTVRRLSLLLVLAAFGLSMFITNDVGLITFVPLTILMLREAGQRALIITVVMETVGANLGSALTPFGNPQNLYLYSRYGMGMGEFLSITGPLCLIGLLLTAGGVLVFRLPAQNIAPKGGEAVFDRRKALFYGALFILSLLAVFRAIPWQLALAVVAAALALADREIFKRVDYSLLVTFVFFFILVGNLGSIPAVEGWVSGLLKGRELLVSALVSQFISNVPAALMLSGFTDNWQGLLAGTNIGGLGTLIASMASLISFRLYAKSEGAKAGKYFAVFTAWNFAYLLVMLAAGLLLWR